jgi:CMP-N,N'-diacetyllegionaminic acid synthase
MRVHAIILARGGSKGIPGKNIIDFCGKPLLAWTILQALKTKAVFDVWVSSDSHEILNIASSYGAKTILRPTEISGDMNSSESAWLHAIKEIEGNINTSIEYILAPQVTSPLRSIDDFELGIKKIISSGSDSLMSVVEIEDHFIWEENKKNKLVSVNYDFTDRKLRQKIKKKYLENGSFYIFKTKIIREESNRLGGKISTYIMDRYKMFQIDNAEDIELCSVIMKGYQLNQI